MYRQYQLLLSILFILFWSFVENLNDLTNNFRCLGLKLIQTKKTLIYFCSIYNIVKLIKNVYIKININIFVIIMQY